MRRFTVSWLAAAAVPVLAISSVGLAALPSQAAWGAAPAGATSGHVYWSTAGACPSGGGFVGRASLGGTGVVQNFIAPGTCVAGIAVTSKYLYWTQANGGTAAGIGRANLNGTGANPGFITVAHNSCGVAVSGSFIYWAGDVGTTIGRANLNGTGVNQNFLTVTSTGPTAGVRPSAGRT